MSQEKKFKHLIDQYSNTDVNVNNNEITENDNKSKVLKKDLVNILIISLLMIVLLVGLMILDKNSNYIANIADKLVSFFIK